MFTHWSPNNIIPCSDGGEGGTDLGLRPRRSGFDVDFADSGLSEGLSQQYTDSRNGIVTNHVQASEPSQQMDSRSSGFIVSLGYGGGTSQDYDPSIAWEQYSQDMYHDTIPPDDQRNLPMSDQSYQSIFEAILPDQQARFYKRIDCCAFDDRPDSVRYTSSTRPKFATSRERGVDGYVKIHLQHSFGSDWNTESGSSGSVTVTTKPLSRSVASGKQSQKQGLSDWSVRIPIPPPGFGRNFQLEDAESHMFFDFYRSSFAIKRTLLLDDNMFTGSVLRVMDSVPAVMHAALNLAAAYVVEIDPSPMLLERANLHYRKAVHLYKQLFDDFSVQKPGSESVEAFITLNLLLTCNDIIYWEKRLSFPEKPRWYKAAREAKVILDGSDPGYNYHSHPHYVQASKLWLSVSNYLGFVNILADAVRPLERIEKRINRPYNWLIEGTPAETTQLSGSTGVSPWLLHKFAMINHLAARFLQDSDNHSIFEQGVILDERLEGLHQSSLWSKHYASFQALLDDCENYLDPQTQTVNDRGRVIDLISHSWVATARILLDCRLFRRSRSDPKVLSSLEELRKCVSLMPLTGDLFTAQSPFFPIFILGVVGVAQDRVIATHWFKTVCARDRNSVAPVWKSLQQLWLWMDGQTTPDDQFSFDESLYPVSVIPSPGEILQRIPWWELIVQWLAINEGYLSLV